MTDPEQLAFPSSSPSNNPQAMALSTDPAVPSTDPPSAGSTRPNKCPLPICSYHTLGFTHAYDRDRHLLSHYTRPLACPFCDDGPSDPAPTFPRVDLFKRHLLHLHLVQRLQPIREAEGEGQGGSGRELDGGWGKCSACWEMLGGPQAMFDHLDGCISGCLEREGAFVRRE
ncbi:hypothetical protein MMC13_000538 [Lambiella insularis]|nr:hypothetical protein [Lambiella insularis]